VDSPAWTTSITQAGVPINEREEKKGKGKGVAINWEKKTCLIVRGKLLGKNVPDINERKKEKRLNPS